MISTEQLYQRARQLENETDEILQRECIKISYYAVLHKIQEVCDQQGITLGQRLNTGTHEHLIERIHCNHSGKVIANTAKIMKRKRIKADYYLNENITAEELQKQLKLAEECWYRLSNFSYQQPNSP